MPKWTKGFMYLFELVFSYSLGKYPEVGLLAHTVILFLIFLSNLHSIFHSACTNLDSQWQHMRLFSVSWPTLVIGCLFLSIVNLQYCVNFCCTAKWPRYIYVYIYTYTFIFSYYLFDDTHSDRCEVIPHCGFHLHLPHLWCWTSFYVSIFFGKISILLFCPFFNMVVSFCCCRVV